MHPLRHFHRSFLWAALASLACADDDAPSDDAACYPVDPELPIVPPIVPHCEWRPGEFPEPPEGYAQTHPVSVSFVPTDDQPCDPCNVELFDMLLKAEIERECNAPYAAFERGCYVPPDGTAGAGTLCQVRGIYASDCTPMN